MLPAFCNVKIDLKLGPFFDPATVYLSMLGCEDIDICASTNKQAAPDPKPNRPSYHCLDSANQRPRSSLDVLRLYLHQQVFLDVGTQSFPCSASAFLDERVSLANDTV
ncbi:hypothetical protein HMN09_01084100 [Mycena chlorophos]|uniref:Uncharacterized protein n=1 Tax=Mycena chlorophos TaxID=658473 RepID=A0A8H6SD78_MYCCL|nr:hypothetical protein HMN09_01084100 [Mycena chlorophos]